MSTHFMLADGTRCPRCGDDNINQIVIKDPNFGTNNGLPKSVCLDISEDGEFVTQACLECGFVWIKNEGVASTSQLKSILMSHYIDLIVDCEDSVLEELIDDLDGVGGIPPKSRQLFALSARGDNDDVRLELIRSTNNFLNACDVDTLVEVFNTVYAEDVTEVCNPSDIEEDLEFMAENGMTLDAKKVLADD